MANNTFNKFSLFICTLVTAGLAAAAEAPKLIEMRESDRLEFRAMKQGEVYYRYRLEPFTEAFSRSPLSLYPGYKEPVSDPDRVGIPNMPEQAPIRLTMFVATASTVVDRPAANIDLSQFARLDRLQALDPNVESTRLAESEARRVPRPGQPWCAGAQACLRSTFAIDNATRTALSFRYGKAAKGIFADSEIRVGIISQLASQEGALRNLTAVDEPIASQYVQSLFNFGGVIYLSGIHFEIPVVRFAKIIALAQPMPGDANRSVVTGFYVFAIETHVIDPTSGWIKKLGLPIKDAMLSTWSETKNRVGIARGFPDYTKALSLKIATEIAE